MKLKNIKLLKTLAFTGALGLVAAVPIITATACSTDTSNSGGNSSDSNGSGSGSGSGSDTGTNNGGSSGGSSSGGTDNGGSGSGSGSGTDNGGSGGSSGGGSSGGDSGSDTQTKVTPQLKDSISLIGGLDGVYDSTGTKDTNTLLAESIKNNLESAFTNASDLKDKDLNIKVDGNFSDTSSWTGDNYSTWSKTSTYTAVYAESSKQIDISSLSDLKNQLDNDKLKEILTAANKTFTGATYSVQNQLGLTNDDLIHVNVLITQGSVKNTLDLQIPTSDINLDISNCDISVSGDDINSVENQKVNLDYNIGIDSNTHYVQSQVPTISSTDVTDVTKALNSLGLVTSNKLDNTKIATALGVYNCSFTGTKIKEKTNSVSLVDSSATEDNNKTYTITLTATPNTTDNYVWTDGSNTAKDITFDATFNVTN